MTTTIEDRYYLPPEPEYTPITDTCLYEPDNADICGKEVDHDDAILCDRHLTDLDNDRITWEEYRAIQAHYEIE